MFARTRRTHTNHFAFFCKYTRSVYKNAEEERKSFLPQSSNFNFLQTKNVVFTYAFAHRTKIVGIGYIFHKHIYIYTTTSTIINTYKYSYFYLHKYTCVMVQRLVSWCVGEFLVNIYLPTYKYLNTNKSMGLFLYSFTIN